MEGLLVLMLVVPGKHEWTGHAVDDCWIQAENDDSDLSERAQSGDHEHSQENHERNNNADEEKQLPGHGISWGDSHCQTFEEQPDARSRPDHPGERAALWAAAAHSGFFGRTGRVSTGRRRIWGSPRWAVPHLPIVPGLSIAAFAESRDWAGRAARSMLQWRLHLCPHAVATRRCDAQ